MLRLLLLLSLSLNLLMLGSCGSVKPMPRWEGKWWSADHRLPGVVGPPTEKPRRYIHARNPYFSQGVWVSYEDLACLYEQLILNCKDYIEAQPKCTAHAAHIAGDSQAVMSRALDMLALSRMRASLQPDPDPSPSPSPSPEAN